MTYSIDLCRGWERVGHLTDAEAFTFNGAQRHLAAGAWLLSAPDSAVSWSEVPTVAGSRLANAADVDTIRVCDGRRVVFPGLVRPADSSGSGGLTSTKTADGLRWEWSGPDLWWILSRRVAFPNPASLTWAVSHDVRSGQASTVLAEYLAVNLGGSALAERELPGMTIVDQGAGATGEWSARLQPLSDLAARICADGGITCRLSIDFAGGLTATIGEVRDLSASKVFSDQGDLTSVVARQVPRSATWTLAGGQGNGSSRTFRTADTGATGWDRFEQFTDQASLSSVSELQSAADVHNLAAAGSWSIDAPPTDEAASRWKLGVDILVGDFVSVQINGVRHRVPVTELAWSIQSGRTVVRPTFGAAASDELDGVLRDVGDLASRFRTDVA